jgi:hypothetical protein
MWMEKIRRGVLQITTSSGPRYVEPSFSERVQLLWTFRNFNVLSEQVLNRHERQLLSQLCAEERMQRVRSIEYAPACIIGTFESALPPPPPKKRPQSLAVASRSSA